MPILTKGMIYVIADCRVGICSFNVNKCDGTDTLLLHGAVEVSFNLRKALNDRSAEHDLAGFTARICTIFSGELWKRIE